MSNLFTLEGDVTVDSLRLAFLHGGRDSQLRSATYFSLVALSFCAVFVSFPWRAALRFHPLLPVMAWAFALSQLYFTWRLILIFFVDFTVRYADHPDPPNLFVEAYALVCNSAAGWWWTNNLLCWVAVACPVLYAAAIARGVTARASFSYVTLAFLGAVSVAFPLFLIHILVLPPSPLPPPSQPPPSRQSPSKSAPRPILTSPVPMPRAGSGRLWVLCTLTALASTIALPLSLHTSRPIFIIALGLLHIVLAIPYAAAALLGIRAAPLSPTQLRVLACATALLHAVATAAAMRWDLRIASPYASLLSLAALGELMAGALRAAGRNVCQASVAIDALGAALASTAFTLLATVGRRAGQSSAVAFPVAAPADAFVLGIVSPLIGPGAAFALWMAGTPWDHGHPSIDVAASEAAVPWSGLGTSMRNNKQAPEASAGGESTAGGEAPDPKGKAVTPQPRPSNSPARRKHPDCSRSKS